MPDIKDLQNEIGLRKDHAKDLERMLAKSNDALFTAREALECIATAAHGATLYITYENIRDIARKALHESDFNARETPEQIESVENGEKIPEGETSKRVDSDEKGGV